MQSHSSGLSHEEPAKEEEEEESTRLGHPSPWGLASFDVLG